MSISQSESEYGKSIEIMQAFRFSVWEDYSQKKHVLPT